MAKKDPIDFVHTGPGTLAGQYLRMFWQPVCRAQDLAPGRAVPIRIMSEELTLYRGESGTPHVVAFRCAHRATQLSTGWVEGDCIRCRYHGWKYTGTGQCVEQPGEEDSFAAKVKIRSYPVREYLGLIFAYLGEGEPPPFRRFPDLEKTGLLLNGLSEVWPCNYFNRLDNAGDAGHVAFTHREGALRAKAMSSLITRKIISEETEYGMRTAIKVPEEPVSYLHFHMPNVNQIRAKLGRGNVEKNAAPVWSDRLFFRVPMDDEHCVSFGVILVHVSGEAARSYRERAREEETGRVVLLNNPGDAILAGKMRIEDFNKNHPIWDLFWVEDYVVQVGQGAIADRSAEQLGHMDSGVILLRKIWERELRAVKEGRPFKQWITPAGLADESAMTA
jgi:5,5'-dehydrodivanillate O-demethylase